MALGGGSWDDPDCEFVRELCEANGLSESTFVHRAGTITELEMFMYNCPKMNGFCHFPNLTSLTINLQHVTEIEQLHTAIHLESLWVVNCKLTRISGLEACTQLKKLCLFSNNIEKMEGLSTLAHLEELWLDENSIKTIEGLDLLSALRLVSLASNCIEFVGGAFNNNLALAEVNLACNQFGSFKDVLNLSRLPLLTRVEFSNPNYGSNPLCRLCNYQTYMLYHLPQISHLDSIYVLDESKQLAEVTYLKKRMYYNMRIKSLKSNTTSILRRAKDTMLSRLHLLTNRLNTLARLKLETQRALEEFRCFGKMDVETDFDEDDKERYEAMLVAHLTALDKNLASKTALLQSFFKNFDSLKRKLIDISEYNISRFIVELETGGNFRLEDGKPSDLWYSSCVDLVNSRAFLDGGAYELRVVRVTKIHNRFLKNRFEDLLKLRENMNNDSYKKNFEYLFYGEDPALPGEVLRVAEFGFREISDYKLILSEEGVPLTNSVHLCDAKRFASLGDSLDMPNGQLLITKTFVPRFCELASLAALQRSDYSGYDAVCRVLPEDARQRSWFVFERALVLPEYLVEFEYVDTRLPPQQQRLNPHREPPVEFVNELADKGLLTPHNESEMMDIGPIARTVVKFVFYCDQVAKQHHEDADFDALVKSHPAFEDRPKAFSINGALLSKWSYGARLMSLKYLNLHGNCIRKIEGLDSLVNLSVLVLSFNDISKMEGLTCLGRLERLDLSYNHIKRIEGLKSIQGLLTFHVNNNNINRPEDLSVLRKYTSTLTDLDLRNNALCDIKGYRRLVLRRLKHLEKFDGQGLSDEELVEALESSFAITPDLIRQHSYTSHRANFAVRLKHLQPMEQASNAGMDLVEELELSRRHIRKITHLDSLPNLRRLNLCENEVSRIDGLDTCTKLEELLLEDNRVVLIENLGVLRSLKKLDLGKNKITSLAGLEGLHSLSQLSLEDNEVEHIGTSLQTLTSLAELYLANNQLSHIQEVLSLRELPKLLIVDFSNNSLCTFSSYRLYTVFYLRRLKVLDGVVVDHVLRQEAREAYSGKLTEEVLVEKIGGKPFAQVRELDFSSSKLRLLGSLLTADRFLALRLLNLDTNCIVGISELAALTSLTVLRLNSNKIADISASDARPHSAPLAGLTKLEILQLAHNEITTLACSGLQLLVRLTVLHLQGNQISKIEAIAGLSRLRELFLDKNRIRVFDEGCFDHLDDLRELRLDDNGLKSMVYLPPLPRLQTLSLGYNRLSDLCDVERLGTMPRLQEVTLVSNPIARKQLYRATVIFSAKSLQMLDFKEVSAEERERIEVTFALENRPSASAILPAEVNRGGTTISKVPMKVNAVTFDSDSGSLLGNLPVPLGSGSHSTGHTPLPAAVGDWNPYTNSMGEFYVNQSHGKSSARPDPGRASRRNDRTLSAEAIEGRTQNEMARRLASQGVSSKNLHKHSKATPKTFRSHLLVPR